MFNPWLVSPRLYQCRNSFHFHNYNPNPSELNSTSSNNASNMGPCNLAVSNVPAVKEYTYESKFRQRVSFDLRRQERLKIKARFPHKTPVIMERAPKERHLPSLTKHKYLVCQSMTMSQLLSIIRQQLNLDNTTAVFFLVEGHHNIQMSKLITEVYNEFQSEDGFLYITYASQDVFGQI